MRVFFSVVLTSRPLSSGKNEKKPLLEPVRIETNGTSFNCHTIVGHGSFGVVFQALIEGSDETVAIKKVLQDRRFKVRSPSCSGAKPGGWSNALVVSRTASWRLWRN